MPHSSGSFLAGWLAGVVSFEDMALITHQCTHLMAEAQRLAAREEVQRWFFNPHEKLSAEEIALLQEIRRKVDPGAALDCERLATQLGGRLELLFALSAPALESLQTDLEKQRIGVSRAISMSPHCAIFAGNELQMARFDALFAGTRRLEFRRVRIEINGTPHFSRLKAAADKITELLRTYHQQGRLRDPVLPLVSCQGDWVTTREQFIEAIAGIADRPMPFDRMIQRSLEQGGRHYFLVQSGMSATAADLLDGTIQDCANRLGYEKIRIYPSVGRQREGHPICALLPTGTPQPAARNQSLTDTLRWYEQQLFPGDRASTPIGPG